jgi:MFS family permease
VLLVSAIFGGFIVCCLAANWVPPGLAIALLIAGFVLHAAGDGLQYPLVRVWANESFEGVERATMLSVMSSAGLLLIGAMHAVNGVLIGIGGTKLAFFAVLAIWAAGAIGCWQALRRVGASGT